MVVFFAGLAASMILTALGIYQNRRVAKRLLLLGACLGLLVMIVGGVQWFIGAEQTPAARPSASANVQQSGQGNINVQGSQNTITVEPKPQPTPPARPAPEPAKSAQAGSTMNAPGGMNITGGTVNNPTINTNILVPTPVKPAPTGPPPAAPLRQPIDKQANVLRECIQDVTKRTGVSEMWLSQIFKGDTPVIPVGPDVDVPAALRYLNSKGEVEILEEMSRPYKAWYEVFNDDIRFKVKAPP